MNAATLPRDILCIVCPTGCRIHVEAAAAGGLAVSGNRCPRGADFARAEVTAPVRVLTTTVRTAFPRVPVLPVRTAGGIPKAKIRELMSALASITITRPLAAGDPVLPNALALGVDVIATSGILRELSEDAG